MKTKNKPKEDKKNVNRIEVGELVVESSTSDIKELHEVVDKLLTKHRKTLTNIKRKEPKIPMMFG